MSQLTVGGQLGSPVLGAALTVGFFLTFVFWTWWAYRPANRENMDAASRLPFEGGE